MGARLLPSVELYTPGKEPAWLPRRVAVLVCLVIAAADLAALYFFESRGLSNLYGDGIAHVEGARRMFDSLTPGYAQIGTVWLPLFHLLAAPLAISNTLWRTGLAGSLVSAAAFAVAAWFVFRLSFEMNGAISAGVAGLAGFLLCLNLLYLASAPMTESLAILLAVLVAFGLFRFQQSGKTGTLIAAAVAAFCGTLTRYDGWYLLPFAALFVFFCGRRSWRRRAAETVCFSLIAGCGPVLWLIHNDYRYHNPLEFYNGPQSAQAIYAHQLATTAFRYPTDGSVWLSAHYYLADMRLVLGPWILILASLGLTLWMLDRQNRRRRSAMLLLLVPLPFYIQSLAFAGVPIYVPTLFPHTYYNLRYGLEMAPAVAVLTSFLVSRGMPARSRKLVLGILIAVLAGQWIGVAAAGARNIPVVTEAILNTPSKSPAVQDVIRFLRAHYDGRKLLMDDGEWACVMSQLDISYRNALTPSNRPYWRELHQEASRWVGWIVVKRGDAVDQLMHAYPNAFSSFVLADKNPLPHGSYVRIYRRRPQYRTR